MNSNIELKGKAISPDGQNQAYLLRKTNHASTLNYAFQFTSANGDWRLPVTAAINADYYFAMLNRVDGSLRSWSIDATNASISNPLMEYDGNGNLFIAINFSGLIQTPLGQLQSNGENDILLVKLDATGGVEWFRQYGSQDDEQVVDMVLANQGVYLGGQFSGYASQREIGDFVFVNQSLDETSKAFVTYVSDTQETIVPLKNKDERFVDGGIHIYPNPFSEEFRVDIPSQVNDNAHLRIYNLKGQLLLEQQIGLKQGVNTQQVSLSTLNIPKGTILVVRVDLASGQQVPFIGRILQY